MKFLESAITATVLACLTGSLGCAPKKKPLLPILFRHCTLIQEADGRQGCNCMKPLIVNELDVATKRYRVVAYCDGKAQ